MAMKGACERVGVGLDRVEDIVAGCVNPAHEGMGDVARWAALSAGFPDSVAGATINRFCGSSLSATVNISHAIKAGDLGVGVESMSRSGWAYMKGDAPFSPRGPVILLDTMWAGAGGPPNPALMARNAYIAMIETAQDVADRYGLTREEIDAFALRSQGRAKAARDSGRLAKEILPVQIAATKKTAASVFEHDDFIRDDTTAEKLAALPVQPGTSQMTAANSTPLTDGASAVVLASGRRQQNSVSSRWPACCPRRSTGSTRWSWVWRRRGRSRWPSAAPDSLQSRSTYGRSMRPSVPRHSVSFANFPTSSVGSRFLMRSSLRTAAPSPSDILSAPREPATS
jgi:3-oxo-5,6-didehydrosuberyl-CoA/3-oxoadipyl-CoA thiolase